MATGTGPRYCSMVENRWIPAICRMAIIASRAGRHMAGGLALGCCAVMTAGASPRHCRVIEAGYAPTCTGVAGIAGGAGRDRKSVV